MTGLWQQRVDLLELSGSHSQSHLVSPGENMPASHFLSHCSRSVSITLSSESVLFSILTYPKCLLSESVGLFRPEVGGQHQKQPKVLFSGPGSHV